MHLSSEDFKPQYNIEWNINHKQQEQEALNMIKRNIFFPLDERNMQFNVIGRSEKVIMTGQPWTATKINGMYHGTKKENVKQVKILEIVLISEKIKKVGSEVYFSNHIEVAERYFKPTTNNGYSISVAIYAEQTLKNQNEQKQNLKSKRNKDIEIRIRIILQ